jgi:hypothetical protein
MYRFIPTHNFVMRITDVPVLRTFFTIYLMEENDAKREQIDDDFWEELNQLPPSESLFLKERMRETLKKLPEILEEYEKEIDAYLKKRPIKKAA